jgi:hypothetical protein
MPIVIAMWPVVMSAMVVRGVLVLFHEESSAQVNRKLPWGCGSKIGPRRVRRQGLY